MSSGIYPHLQRAALPASYARGSLDTHASPVRLWEDQVRIPHLHLAFQDCRLIHCDAFCSSFFATNSPSPFDFADVLSAPLLSSLHTQAVPDEESLSHIAFPSSGAATPLRLCGVLPEAVHRDSLLHFLLPWGRHRLFRSCADTVWSRYTV